jgi:hypothetical protein
MNTISRFLFTVILFSSNFSFSQFEKSADSIIIALTNDFCKYLPNKIDVENSEKCYTEYLKIEKEKLKSTAIIYSDFLRKNNLVLTDSLIFKPLVLIKKRNLRSSNYEVFFKDLKKFSDSLSIVNENNSFRILVKLQDKYVPKHKIKVQSKKKKDLEVQNSFLSVQNIAILLAFVAIILILLKITMKKKDRILELEKKEKKLTKKIIELEREIVDSYSKNTLLRSENIKLGEELKKISQKLNSPKNTDEVTIKSQFKNESDLKKNKKDNQERLSEIVDVLYFRIPTLDGNFRDDLKTNVFESSLTMFKLEVFTNKREANFSFVGDLEISKTAAYYPDSSISLVCDFENTTSNFTSRIETTSKGEVELRNDIWVVTKMAKIKFS